MKKMIIGIATAITAVLVGCKSVPTDSQMYTSAYAIGASTGLIANMTKIDDATRNAVIDIVNIADACAPATNQTFTEAWTPIATNHIYKLIDAGKIDTAQGVLIAKTFDIVCNGIDYLFNVRYPKARQYQELVEAATHGFSDGFLKTFKPVNAMAASESTCIDEAAFRHLSSKYLKK